MALLKAINYKADSDKLIINGEFAGVGFDVLETIDIVRQLCENQPELVTPLRGSLETDFMNMLSSFLYRTDDGSVFIDADLVAKHIKICDARGDTSESNLVKVITFMNSKLLKTYKDFFDSLDVGCTDEVITVGCPSSIKAYSIMSRYSYTKDPRAYMGLGARTTVNGSYAIGNNNIIQASGHISIVNALVINTDNDKYEFYVAEVDIVDKVVYMNDELLDLNSKFIRAEEDHEGLISIFTRVDDVEYELEGLGTVTR